MGPAGSHYSGRVADAETGRVDSWIWSVRLAKTRSAAASACRAGHVRVNGTRVKPAHTVRPGDEVRVRQEDRDRIVEVVRVISKRVSAPMAAECYADHSPPPPPREEAVVVAVRDRGAGRPTKRERRTLEKWIHGLHE
jgi:ribosome-associated heat shock protein Hsp15